MSPPLPHHRPENSDAMRRAEAVSQWELGDPTWANMILAAYFDPDNADAAEALVELAPDLEGPE